MSAIDAAALVSAQVQAKLSAIPNIATLAPGGVRNTTRPQGGEFPVIVHTLGPGPEDSPGYGAVDSVEYLNIDVKVISTDKLQANVGTILGAIHTALQGVSLDLGTDVHHMQTMSLRRIPTYPETAGSTRYIHRGRTYQITVSHGPA